MNAVVAFRSDGGVQKTLARILLGPLGDRPSDAGKELTRKTNCHNSFLSSLAPCRRRLRSRQNGKDPRRRPTGDEWRPPPSAQFGRGTELATAIATPAANAESNSECWRSSSKCKSGYPLFQSRPICCVLRHSETFSCCQASVAKTLDYRRNRLRRVGRPI
jgi:hypothetical protein